MIMLDPLIFPGTSPFLLEKKKTYLNAADDCSKVI